MSTAVVRGLRVVGRLTVDGVWRLGAASRFMSLVLLRSATTFRRFRLLVDEVYFAGALSLIIIIVSGLFVGLVLGLQGYETLKRYGSAEAVGTLVALSLDHAYQAFENVLVRLERALGLPARTSPAWHRALLADAALAVPGLRPALFPGSVEGDWDELRRFRHFLRHAYPLDLDPRRLRENVGRLQRAVSQTDEPVRAVFRALA